MAGLVIAAVNEEISPKSEPGAVVLGLLWRTRITWEILKTLQCPGHALQIHRIRIYQGGAPVLSRS